MRIGCGYSGTLNQGYLRSILLDISPKKRWLNFKSFKGEQPRIFFCHENGRGANHCGNHNVPQIWSISFYDKHLYWVEEDHGKSTMMKKNIFNDSSGIIVERLLPKIEEISVVSPQIGWGYCLVDKQLGKSDYEESGERACPGLCIAQPISEPHQYASECVCPTHHQDLKEFPSEMETHVCSPPHTFLLYAQAWYQSSILTTDLSH